MGIRHLNKMFLPKSICVIGAKSEEKNPGYIVIRNLISGGFDGPVMPVGTSGQSVCGILSYLDVNQLPIIPDLAVICDDQYLKEDFVTHLADMGIKAVMLVGFHINDCDEIDFRALALNLGIRILGPNSYGAIVPGHKFNASLFHLPAKKGKIAVVSQSSALATTILDWANAHDIGFSHFISTGFCSDVGFGDLLDFLGSDPFTRAILVYLESLEDRRNFLSAARATARNKPVIVMKAGKHQSVSHITQSHTGAMAGSDSVYDAVFRRSGMLRVNGIAELFAAAETLSVNRPFNGKRLAIMSNGGGLNVLAVDHLLDGAGQVAELSEETIENISKILGQNWKGTNPIDMGFNSTPKQYAEIYEILKKAREVDCVLCMHAPNIKNDSVACAQSLIESYKKIKGNLITCWSGEQSVQEARHLFEQAEIATYTSPRLAVMGFLHIVEYKANQESLIQTPERMSASVKPARNIVRHIIDDALARGDSWLSEEDTKAIFKGYGISVVAPHIVKTVEEAKKVAQSIGYPVVVKIKSRDVVHKSDVGGVVLNVQNDVALAEAINGIEERLKCYNPDAKLEGFILQSMQDRTNTHELIAGMTHDPIFGPVMLFGQGGKATEIIGDKSIALPPLNMVLARDMINRTKISKLLAGFRDQPAIDFEALCQVLIEMSEICIDFPQIREMEINPIFSSDKGALAVDARIRLEPCETKYERQRLAIRPYPADLEEEFVLRDGRKVLIRPIKPEDEPAHNEFLSRISPEDIRFRFFGSVRELPHSEMARLTQLDYDREMAFIAQAKNLETGEMETLGVVRTGTDPNNEEAEYAILVRSDLKGQKLGWKLLNKMIDYCRKRGTTYFIGQILRQNRTMLDMVKAMGFEAKSIPDEDIVEVRLKL